MQKFRRYISEDSAKDAAFRAEAESVYRVLYNFITDKFLEGKLARYLMKRNDGAYAAMATDLGAPHKYEDLILIFKQMTGATAGGFGFFNKTPVIFISALKRPDDIDSIMNFSKPTFIHEFIHYLDFKRYKNTNSIAANRISDGQVTVQQYVNNPAEFNAYYQEITSNIEFTMQKTKDKVGMLNWYGKDARDFVGRAAVFFPSFFYDNLNNEYKQKLQKRLYSFYVDTLAPMVHNK